jgi:hypothetical protein
MDIYILNMIMLVRNKIERFTSLRTCSSRKRRAFVACLRAGDVLYYGDIKLKLARGFPLHRDRQSEADSRGVLCLTPISVAIQLSTIVIVSLLGVRLICINPGHGPLSSL